MHFYLDYRTGSGGRVDRNGPIDYEAFSHFFVSILIVKISTDASRAVLSARALPRIAV
jgi:hypothetical protein